MDYKKFNEIISDNLKELSELVDYIFKQEKISNVDVDLILERLRNLYDLFLVLKKQIIPEQSNYAEIPFKINSKAADEEKFSKTKQGLDEDQNVSEEEHNILSDRFKSETTILYESLSSKKKNDITSKILSKPIKNISAYIGLNEKYAIIKDLFKGDDNKYNEFISIIDNSPNFYEAYNYLTQVLMFDENNSLVKFIIDLLRRKFIIKDE